MRTFIAVDVPDDVKLKIGSYIDTLKGDFETKKVKWVKPENLHFTIKFLGEIKRSEIDTIVRCIDYAASDFEPFLLGLSGIGFFPSETKPKVLWVGADGGGDYLLDIYQKLENCLEVDGYDRDSKPFSPHLTIGRVRRYEKLALPQKYTDFDTTHFQIEGLTLYRSTLTPEGPVYDKLHQSKFAETVQAQG